MGTIAYSFIALVLLLVVAAGIYGGVVAHKAVNGTATAPETAVGAVWVTGLIVVACLVAFVTSYAATFLSQFG